MSRSETTTTTAKTPRKRQIGSAPESYSLLLQDERLSEGLSPVGWLFLGFAGGFDNSNTKCCFRKISPGLPALAPPGPGCVVPQPLPHHHETTSCLNDNRAVSGKKKEEALMGRACLLHTKYHIMWSVLFKEDEPPNIWDTEHTVPRTHCAAKYGCRSTGQCQRVSSYLRNEK